MKAPLENWEARFKAVGEASRERIAGCGLPGYAIATTGIKSKGMPEPPAAGPRKGQSRLTGEKAIHLSQLPRVPAECYKEAARTRWRGWRC